MADNGFEIKEPRAREVLYHVFTGGDTPEQMLETFMSKESLFESCYLCDYLLTSMLPMSKEKGGEEYEYFMGVYEILQKAIWNKLKLEKRLFTLVDEEKNNLVVKNGAMYVFYTDRHRAKEQYKYIDLDGEKDILSYIVKDKLDKLYVSDGEAVVAVVETKNII